MEEATTRIHQLDLKMAAQNGLINKKLLPTNDLQLLDLKLGRVIYEDYMQRPLISGGPKLTTQKRYRAVLNKFFDFAITHNIKYWNQVNKQILDSYATWLDKNNYAYNSQYTELTVFKQILKYLAENGRLPKDQLFFHDMKKDESTNTYCWSDNEYRAMIQLCNDQQYHWLRFVLIGLATTGVRISELAQFRWGDFDLDKGQVSIVDESRRKKSGREPTRTTKSGKSRTLPIHSELLTILKEIKKTSDGYVFHGPKGGRIKPDTIRRIFIRDVLTPLSKQFPNPDGGVGFKDGRLHSFRHFFCSTCANKGVSEQVIMKWLGHSSSRMVKRYYHLNLEESKKQMEKVQFC